MLAQVIVPRLIETAGVWERCGTPEATRGHRRGSRRQGPGRGDRPRGIDRVTGSCCAPLLASPSGSWQSAPEHRRRPNPHCERRYPKHMATDNPYTWGLEGSSAVDIDTSGRIVDYIDPTRTRAATPEERVRQAYARVLVEEYGYPKDRIVIENAIAIGSETKSADIVVYDSPTACQQRNQKQRKRRCASCLNAPETATRLRPLSWRPHLPRHRDQGTDEEGGPETAYILYLRQLGRRWNLDKR